MSENQIATLETVSRAEQRLRKMRAQVTSLKDEDGALSAEIAETLAKGKNAEKPRARRSEVRQLVSDLTEAITVLEKQVSEDCEVVCTAAAADRLKGIARAFGSIRQEIGEDEAGVQAAAANYAAAVSRINNRFKSLALLRAEAAALSDRFKLVPPSLPTTELPAMRKPCIAAALTVDGVKFVDHIHTRPGVEKDEFGVRTRRTYAEIAGTPADEIIKAAGLKSWPELTEAQEAIVAAREHGKAEEREFVARVAGDRGRSLERAGL